MAAREAPRSGIGVVVNPLSRRHRSTQELTERLRRDLGGHGLVAEAGTPDQLRRIAEDFRRQGIDILALSGGDGTTGFALTTFREVYGDAPLPKVALLRGGTMNTIANGVGLPRRGPQYLLRRLVASYVAGRRLRSSRRVALSVRHEDGSERLGFLFGMGLGHGFLEEYYRLGDPHPTPVTAAHTLTRLAASILVRGETARRVVSPIEVAITTDGRAWPKRRYLTILAGTVEQVGLGFEPFFRVRDATEAFHLQGVYGKPPQVVARLHRIRLGRPLGEKVAEEALIRHATFDCGGEVPYFLDGDLFRAEGVLEVSVGPRVRIVWG